MRPARGWEAEAYGYGSLILLSLAATLQAPGLLTGGSGRSLLYIGYFVGAVWVSALLVASAARLALAIAGLALAFAFAMQLAIIQFGLKEVAEALSFGVVTTDPVGDQVGALENAAFLGSALLLTWALLVRRAGSEPSWSSVAKALLVVLSVLLLGAIACSRVTTDHFLSPLSLTFQTYLMPVMAMSILVLIWNFVGNMKWKPGSPRA
jgi:hypothetical protein